MDYLPKELFYQIMYYLDIQDINTIDGIFPRISENEYFWTEYLTNNRITFVKRESIKGYYQKFLFINKFTGYYGSNLQFNEMLDNYGTYENYMISCSHNAFINMQITLINKTKICDLYSIISNIDPFGHELYFKIKKNLLKICVYNPLNEEKIDTKYLTLLEDKAFQRYKIDLSKKFLTFDRIMITKSDLEQIIFIIHSYQSE